MNKGILRKGLSLAGVLFLCPGIGQALEVDVYGGFGAGHAVQKQDASDDTSDTGEKLYVGTRFLGPWGSRPLITIWENTIMPLWK